MELGGLSGQDSSAQNAFMIAPAKPDRNRKRLKLENKPPATTDIAKLRQQICEHKKKCQAELKDVYRDNLAELFFLQHGLNIMDMATWKKKPNNTLDRYLKSYSFDPEDDDLVEVESQQTAVKSEPQPNLDTKAEVKTPIGHNIAIKSISGRPSQESQSNDAPTPPTSEAIVEQARKEAQVMQRVAELRKQGLWSAKRMPKVQEPPRSKAHWDYLLEEMQWLAADFAQERKWKKAGCRKISKMIMRFHNEKLDDERRAEKEESSKLRKIAGQLARQIKEFWSSIEKVVQYKHDSRLDEKRRKALDLHLNFIVGQTEKYSSWLSAGLAGTAADTSGSKVPSSSATTPGTQTPVEDNEFQPQSASSDDEETIAKEEEQNATDQNDTDAELAALQAESEMPMDELLASLPPGVLERPASVKSTSSSDDSYHSANEDNDFQGESSEAVDDEQTLVEQEQHEEKNYDDELKDLKDEGDMTVEELAAKYAGAYASDFEMPDSASSTDADDDDGEDDNQESSSSDEETADDETANDDENDNQEDIGMEYLLNPEKDETDLPAVKESGDGPTREITDIAAAAQSLQPTGYTLETTQVKTPVPFLLKHSLREYQHVGLDWLATMYEKKLNGILADEMGLGKTIQTIALLAHLACEHEVWGPHLIVVPTSVMLNWEMELKKWCPGFKILTYYGTPKERKMKRVGWTKTNAFHVCITSYKLVIQDHIAFKRKKWKYLILDEAQNIKNFKSQRWQTLLNFSSQRRLLLTGTPLQNNLMELWSLMHFLMPNVFHSHMDFKEWFSNPLTGMIEGNSEYNEQLIRRLHKVLRPFLLRRLKADVEKQLPKKVEHVVMCKLSKRQRYLYDEFMSRRDTKNTLATGNFMSVINILMQLRKVCNHPDMFDPRPIISPFGTERLSISAPSVVAKAMEYLPLREIKLNYFHPNLSSLEQNLSLYGCHRSRELQTPKKLIEAIDDMSCSPSRPPPTKLRPFVIRSPTPSLPKPATVTSSKQSSNQTVSISSSIMRPLSAPAGTTKSVIKQELNSGSNVTLTGPLTSLVSSTSQKAVLAGKSLSSTATSQPITLQIQQTPQGTRLMIPSSQLSQLQGCLHIIQTSSGQHLITSAGNAQSLANASSTVTSGSSKIVPISNLAISGAGTKANSLSTTPGATVDPATGRPVLRVAPLANTSASTNPSSVSTGTVGSTIAKLTTSAGTLSGMTVSQAVTSAVNGTDSVHAKVQTPTSKQQVTATITPKPGGKPVILGPASRKRALENEAKQKFKNELKLDDVEERCSTWNENKVNRLIAINKKHCSYRPVYGTDLHDAVDIWRHGLCKDGTYFSNSVMHCYNASQNPNPNYPTCYWSSTNYLQSLILNGEQRFDQMKDIWERFVFVTPPVKTSPTQLHTSRKSDLSYDDLIDYVSQRRLRDQVGLLHPIKTRMLVQFPEKRLIQYDCGKLQTLDLLLRELKQGHHRVLIFTQMTKMLNVLEAFLNYHGHRYLRLDGTTRVEMRQALMDRFNADDKIFVFILSTRSGGIGVNLTGADTVIFYDSDWNPTMDAQAQDRCHRIGQTRDVHIYRLISEKTIEENILKKANQKRLLGDVAIEGGNFTTAKLQQGTITDLFAEPSGLQNLADRGNEDSQDATASRALPAPAVAPKLNEKQFEQALGEAEDDEDVRAAADAVEEAGAELAEFDENIPWDEREAEINKQQSEKCSKVEQEIAMLEKELTPVERYAVQFLETTDEQFSEEAVKQAELDIEQAKRDWELNRLKQQREEEERIAELEEDEMLYTYSKEDGMNQTFKDSVTGENMPMWCPPTPPRLENDVYVDQSMCFLYDSAVMTESQLPPVYIKKEKKRPRDTTSTAGGPKKKAKVSEDPPQPLMTSPRVPKSLFDRPNAALLKLRRDKNPFRPGMSGTLMKMGITSTGLQKTPQVDSGHQDQPEWLIHEDWSLLQAVQTLLQLPLNLTVLSPAHIPNWDLVSDIVSTTSRIYRSPKQCRLRYENVIIPREEGKLMYEANPRKSQKKPPKTTYKAKGNKGMRTGQLYTQDSGSSVTTLHAFRFDCIKNVASKRTPTLRPTLVNPTMKNPKHTAVISECGIQYDTPLNPEEVAKIRQERIRTEKTKAAAEQQQQRANQATAARAVSIGTAIISPVTKSNLSVSSVPIARTLSGSIVVSTPGTATFSPINKRLASSNATITGIPHVTQASALTAGPRKISDLHHLTRGTPLMQRVQSGSTVSGTQRTITVQQQALPITQTGKSLTQLTPAQINLLKQQQAQRAAGTTLVAQRTAVSGATQLLTGQQVQQTVVASAVPTLVKTVNSASGSNMTGAAVNINVSLPQGKTLTGTQGKTTLNPSQQFRQIQLLSGKGRTLTQQKIGLAQNIPGKPHGASVQIVQQKIGQQKIGVQQIQQFLKQPGQIITTPSGSSVTTGQTIIANTQLINPASMHATITKMTTPSSNSGSSSVGGISNVTVSLARPISTGASTVAIVPSAITAASLVQSPSKVVATSATRPAAMAVAHRVAGAISAAGGTTPTSVVTLQGQPSVATSIVGRSTVHTIQQLPSSSGTTILQTRTPTAAINSQTLGSTAASVSSTVLQQTVHATKSTVASSSSVTVNPPSHAQAQAAVHTTSSDATASVSVAATASSVAASASTPTSVVSDASRDTVPISVSSELTISTSDGARTYAMRPRKTT